VVAVGSTLSVYPAAHVPEAAVDGGAPLVIINRGATDLDHRATAIVDGSAGIALASLVAALR
jgi:NAD-dependent deacetylase